MPQDRLSADPAKQHYNLIVITICPGTRLATGIMAYPPQSLNKDNYQELINNIILKTHKL